MQAECITDLFGFAPVEKRKVVACFDGGAMTSDAGALLLGAADRGVGLVDRLAQCFTDARCPELIEHEVRTLVGQRVFGLALGYEDLIDHDVLRHDPVMAVLAGKLEARRKDCAPVAGKSTLNRLELSTRAATRYHKISHDAGAIESLFVDLFIEAHRQPPKQIVLDLDATDDPLHGHQEGRFFHGYYKEFCYLPLYIFCGEHLLAAKLRTADNDASVGTVAELERIVPQIRAAWPQVRILVRADSGFCREEIMAWCEAHGVDYLFGLAKNSRLVEAVEPALADAHARYLQTGVAARVFAEFAYQTRDSWSRPRRVVGKAEYLPKGSNPRFVVTSLSAAERAARVLYEEDYCARGDMENRIKEQQLMLFADRTSTAWLRSNQLRLWFSAAAYVLVQALRRLGLAGTRLAQAQCGSIRLWLFKIGALVRVTVRKVWVSLSSACPYQPVFVQIYDNLRRAQPAMSPPLQC
jgi:hypothetical protein